MQTDGQLKNAEALNRLLQMQGVFLERKSVARQGVHDLMRGDGSERLVILAEAELEGQRARFQFLFHELRLCLDPLRFVLLLPRALLGGLELLCRSRHGEPLGPKGTAGKPRLDPKSKP